MELTLKAWRAERLYSIQNLADRAGVSTRTIVQIEHGRQHPKPTTMRKISKALGVEPRSVVEFREAMEILAED